MNEKEKERFLKLVDEAFRQKKIDYVQYLVHRNSIIRLEAEEVYLKNKMKKLEKELWQSWLEWLRLKARQVVFWLIFFLTSILFFISFYFFISKLSGLIGKVNVFILFALSVSGCILFLILYYYVFFSILKRGAEVYGF